MGSSARSSHQPDVTSSVATVTAATVLALPALSFIAAVIADQLFAQPSVPLVNAMTIGLFGGGGLSLLCTPALLVHTWGVRTRVPARVRRYLFGLCVIAVAPVALVVFAVFAIG